MKRLLRTAAAPLALAILLGAAFLVVDGWVAFGKSASGARLARMQASPQRAGGGFVNPQPLWNDVVGSFTTMFTASAFTSPDAPIPVVTTDAARLQTPPSSGLRVTWLGHSTLLIEIEGLRVLSDPIFGERASPFDWVGPARWYPPPIALSDLPPVDAVILSHDHYDHLQQGTIEQMRDWDTLFIAPLGVGAHLEYWGVPAERILELDWWQSTKLGALEVVCTPARHASGRHLLDQNETLWASFALVGERHRAYFSGDTGLFPALQEIGDRYGPFDVTMIEAGAYDGAWPDWHIGPEQAVRAHQMLRGKVLLPIHWGLWNLAAHGWTEPAERVLVEARAKGVTVAIPRPGQSIDPEDLPKLERWWPDVPWRTAEEAPVLSTRMDEG